MSIRYLPPQEVIDVHGIFSLEPGFYRSSEDERVALYIQADKATWYKDEAVHRDGDLPAVIFRDGTIHYACFGKLHRDGGLPACVSANGSQTWYKFGWIHREDGPAVIWADGSTEWWFNGQEYETQVKYEAALAKLKKKGG